jgi:hypothetical protein
MHGRRPALVGPDRGAQAGEVAMALDPNRKRKCFVIMPFGERKDLDGQDIDFDDIYRFFLKKTIEGLDFSIDCVRCDEIEESGSIHEKMFEHIYQADVVVVDITTSNANVYYELGIRHSLAKGVTVLIRRKGTTIPFNIQGLQVVEYDQANFGSVERAKDRIRQIIRNGVANRLIDSPVHEILDLNIEPEGKPIEQTQFHEAPFILKDNRDKAVGLVTGDVQYVKGVDVWVNAENTNMQMSRPFDNTISGIIRYHGMVKKANGQPIGDTIETELRELMKDRGVSVNAAEVIVTTSGAMEQSHGVHRIFHVAANHGQVGRGYTPVPDLASCVVNALEAAKRLPDDVQGKLKSILFPLMGTRSRRGQVLQEQVEMLLDAAIDYLARTPDSPFKKVYFLTYTDKEFEVCDYLLRADKRLDPLKTVDIPALREPVAETQVTAGPAPDSNGVAAEGSAPESLPSGGVVSPATSRVARSQRK